jgi:hypothetical protein
MAAQTTVFGLTARMSLRCSRCGTDRSDFVVTSRDNPQPW